MSTTVTLRGNPIKVEGDLPKPGATSPDFKLTGGDLAEGMSVITDQRSRSAATP